MNALRGGAAQPGGGVTAEALKEYLETETPRIAAANHQSQAPEIINGLAAAPPPIFGSYAPAGQLNVTISFTPTRLGPILLEGPDLSEIKRGPASSGPWTLPLSKGLYSLTDLGNNGQFTFRVGADGEATSVQF
jgi:hypothetical protein